ncbi:hypothetical protein XENORESO_006038 [Xenotaenia resolanae]|uniref:Uncharacterized protein n=1 Tax=Xenotaenia resolanae TaxID=208358 RepID=A0ABV0W5I4_9TELE
MSSTCLVTNPYDLSSNSDNTEDKETKVKEESSGTLCADRTQAQTPRTALFIVNSDFRELGRGFQHSTLDPQLRSMLQWAAASVVDIPQIQLSVDSELQQVILNLFIIQ